MTMAFPQTPLPIKQEIMINGVWVDVTTLTRSDAQVSITRGYSGEQSNISAGTCAFTLDNRNYALSNNNPTSPYYRQLGRNIPYRTGYDTGTTSIRYLDASTPGTLTYDGSTTYAPDAAALDIVGDIDVQVDVDFRDVVGRRGHILISKYQGGAVNQRSWAFVTTATRQLQFMWSTDGTLANRIIATSPVQINPTGRVQYRATLDVDNGSGGWTVSFYIGDGPNITGTWTLLGTATGTGITSIFNSTARVEVGTITLGSSWNSLANGTDADPFVGWFYAARIRNGINGSLVANLRADQTAAGTTSFTDSVGTTWTITGSSYISSTDYRFWGEIPSLPNRSDITNKDLHIPVVANDVLARLNSGRFKKPLPSPVFRNLSQLGWAGYWAMEQETTSTSINAYLGKTGNISNATFQSATTDFAGSGGYLSADNDNGFASGYATAASGAPTVTTYLFYFRMTQLPGSASYAEIMDFYPVNGTAYRIGIYANNAGYRLIIIDSSGTSLVDLVPGGYGAGWSPLNWTAMRVKMSVSGGTVTAEWAWYQTNAPAIVGMTGTYSGTLGRPNYWRWAPWTGKSGMQIAHVAMGSIDLDFTSSAFTASTNAYNGETWLNRFRRLGAEQNFPVFVEGPSIINSDSSFIHTMGVQGLKTLVDLFKECAEIAGGDLVVPRDKLGITIRTYEQEVNQVGPQLNYAAGAISGSLEPEPDVFLIENDVTLTNPAGASFRYAKTTGTLNTADPTTSADAVGTYDVADTVNLFQAGDLEQYTRRRVLFGTWDEARWPKVQVRLERSIFTGNAALTAQIRKVDLMRPISLTNLTPNLSYNPADLMAVGYTEIMAQFTHTITWNTRPMGPWKTGVWGSVTVPTASRWAPKSTTLKTSVTSTATSLTLTTPDPYETWSLTATGYQIEIQGERMTVTVAPASRSGTGPYDYTVTVTRSSNGVVKALTAGNAVTVVNAGRWA